MRVQRLLPLVATVAGAVPATAQLQLYAVDFPGNLYRLDPATGAATLVGSTGVSRLNAAAADPDGFIWSFHSRGPSLDINAIVRINPLTGVGVIVAALDHDIDDIRALAFRGDVLYGIRDALPDELVTIDTASAMVTTIGRTGRSDIQGLTATPDGQLFAVGSNAASLYELDPVTSTATTIATGLPLGIDSQTIEWAFGETAWAARENLRTIDLDSGAVTLVGATGVADIRGLAAVRLPECYANCDESTTAPVLNVLDFDCFLNRFAIESPYANCDGSTAPPALNVLDFNCFLNAFSAGCP